MLEAFDDIDRDWLMNSDRLDLQGKYVLVDFWAYSCINCIRGIPQIEEAYKLLYPKGFIAVGVHTPEFDFEKNPANVSNAIRRLGITYPVVLDQEYYLWAYFNNQFWPAHYLFDPTGELVFESIGEEGTNELLGVLNELFHVELPVLPTHKADNDRTTPELYLGRNRGELGNSPACKGSSCNVYTLPHRMESGKIYLNGIWERHGQFVESLVEQCSIHLDYNGVDISGVFDSDVPRMINCSINGEITNLTIDGPSSYHIYDGGNTGGSLVLNVPKGVRVYTLTFG